LTATPAPGSTFTGWPGPCRGTGPCSIAVDADTTVTATFSAQCIVPKLKGKTLSAAKRLLKAHFCSAGRITHAWSRRVKKEHVISQKPKPHTRLKHGAKINLVTSRGRHP
jgi:uncharacterized repeat protein (TIGR02543 family)